jgi:hypothetical protein
MQLPGEIWKEIFLLTLPVKPFFLLLNKYWLGETEELFVEYARRNRRTVIGQAYGHFVKEKTGSFTPYFMRLRPFEEKWPLMQAMTRDVPDDPTLEQVYMTSIFDEEETGFWSYGQWVQFLEYTQDERPVPSWMPYSACSHYDPSQELPRLVSVTECELVSQSGEWVEIAHYMSGMGACEAIAWTHGPENLLAYFRFRNDLEKAMHELFDDGTCL